MSATQAGMKLFWLKLFRAISLCCATHGIKKVVGRVFTTYNNYAKNYLWWNPEHFKSDLMDGINSWE